MKDGGRRSFVFRRSSFVRKSWVEYLVVCTNILKQGSQVLYSLGDLVVPPLGGCDALARLKAALRLSTSNRISETLSNVLIARPLHPTPAPAAPDRAGHLAP